MKRFGIVTFLTVIAIACSGTLLHSQLTYAANNDGFNFAWDGNESIIMTGSNDFMNKYSSQVHENVESGEGDDDQKGLVFRLENKEGVAARYISMPNVSITAKATNVGGTANCTLTKLYILVDSSSQPNRVTKITYSNDDITASGPAIVPDALMRDSCRGEYEDLLGGNNPRNDNRVDINKDDPIRGNRGQNAIIYSFNDALAKMHDREQSHFVHRTCGIVGTQGNFGNDTAGFTHSLQLQLKRNKDCGEPVRKAYSVIWDQCKYQALQNIPEQSEPIGSQEDAGAAQIASFSECIKSYTGLGINEDLLRHLVVLDLLANIDAESCSVKYIGWVVCPAVRFMAALTDTAFDGLKYLFTIAPLDTGTESGKALYTAWSFMRNIANAIFVALMLLLIISQLTNIGMSNYGIKKLLPKIIVTAVLVNASYILCVIAVDISNVLGSTLKDVFKFLEPTATVKLSSWSSLVESILVYSVPAVGLGLVLLTAGLVALFPLIIGAIVALIIAVLLIVARYAIILSLIILAPVALACYLLPNTKSWFDKWQKMFVSMLMLYPIVSIIYGASTVAALVVMNSGFARPSGEITLQLFGAAIQLLPLALTPILLRYGGPVLSQLGGMAANNGLTKSLRQAGSNFAERRKNARDVKALQHSGGDKRRGIGGLRDRVIQRRYKRKALREMTKQEYNKAQYGYVADQAAKEGRFARGLAKGGGNIDRVIANAIQVQHNLTAEAIKGHKLHLAEKGSSASELTDMATNQSLSAEMRQAALELALDKANSSEFNDIVKRSGGMNKQMRQHVANASMSRGGIYGSSEVAQNIANGAVRDQESFGKNVVGAGINAGHFSARGIGSQSAAEFDEVSAAMDAGYISNEAGKAYSEAAKQAHENKELRASGQATAARDEALKNMSERTWR